MKRLNEIKSLKEFLEHNQILLSESNQKKLELYQQEIISWNKRYNLVSGGDVDHIVERHLLISFYFVKLILDKKLVSKPQIMDLGSGAGFPGVIMSIFFESYPLILLDSSRKKCLFLEHIKKILDLKCEVLCERMENLDKFHDNRYEIITARAVAKLSELIELSRSRLKIGGSLITVKGINYETEYKKRELRNFRINPIQIENNWIKYSSYLSDRMIVKLEKTHD